MAKNFTQLKKQKTFEEFNRYAKRITEDYATSENHFSRSYFCRTYDISSSCFYKLMEYAVVTDLVSDSITAKMMNKAIANQQNHDKRAGGTSQQKYVDMYRKRCEFIANQKSMEIVEDFAIMFACYPSDTKEELASEFGISKKVADLLLVRAIVENIADDDIVERIEKRSIAGSVDKNYTREFFSKLKKQREDNKKEIA